MNVFGIGLPEMALIFVIALLVFGPKKLPEIGSSLGKALKGFQDASREFENEFKRESSKAQKTDSVKMNAQLEPSESEPETVADTSSTPQARSSEKEESNTTG